MGLLSLEESEVYEEVLTQFGLAEQVAVEEVLISEVADLPHEPAVQHLFIDCDDLSEGPEFLHGYLPYLWGMVV